MTRSPLITTLDTAYAADGLLMVPATSGPWQALRDLHGAMSDMRGRGLVPHLTFVYTLATDGRLVHGQHPDATAFVLGYRLAAPNEYASN
jgi:hypothetical protein